MGISSSRSDRGAVRGRQPQVQAFHRSATAAPGVQQWLLWLCLAVISAAALPVAGQDCGWQWSNQRPSKADLLRLRHVDGRFVAVGRQGTVATSTNTEIWHIIEVDTRADLYGLAAGNGLWVAVGWDRETLLGIILASGDGVTWSLRLQAEGVQLKDVAWGDGRWVAVGSGLGDRVLTSSDGWVWTFSPSAAGAIEDAVIWAGDRFVAATGPALATSPDGLAWQPAGTVPAPPPRSLPVAPSYTPEGLFESRYDLDWDGAALLWAGSNTLFRSTDGSSWHLVVEHDSEEDWSAVVSVETVPAFSPFLGEEYPLTLVTALTARWMMYPFSYRIDTSIILLYAGSSMNLDTKLYSEALWGTAGRAGSAAEPGVLVAAGLSGSVLLTDNNTPETWFDTSRLWHYLAGTYPENDSTCEGVRLIGHGPLGLVAGTWFDPQCVIWDKSGTGKGSDSESTSLVQSDPGHVDTLMLSADGESWTYSSEPFSWSPIAADTSVFVQLHSDGVRLSQDGLSWSLVPDTQELAAATTRITWGGGRFVAVGPAGAVYTSDDGSSWVRQAAIPGEPRPGRLTWTGSRFFVIASTGDEPLRLMLMSSDGESWTQLPTLPLGTSARAVASNGSEQVLICRDKLLLGTASGAWQESSEVGAYLDAAYGGGRFVVVGGGRRTLISADGLHWTRLTTPLEGMHLDQVIWTGDRFIGFGDNRTVAQLDCAFDVVLVQIDPGYELLEVGDSTTYTVTISEPSSSGVTLSLGVTEPEAVQVPASVLIPAGSRSVSFSLRAIGQTFRQNEVTATLPQHLGGGQAAAVVLVRPAAFQTAIPDLGVAGRLVLLALLIAAGLLLLRR